MKRFCCVILAAMVALCAALSSTASIATVDGITWKYTVSNGEASIGSVDCPYQAVPTSTTGKISIPSSLDGCPVTSIGDYAFESCNGLTDIAIPNSVTNIGCQAFCVCGGLTNVTLGSGVTSIGSAAFFGCSGLVSVVIPNSVTNIGQSAFASCGDLTNVTIGSGVISIGAGAFSSCEKLMSIVIPNSVTSIGGSAFAGCSGLTSVTIPNSVTNIGNSAFRGCRGLADKDGFVIVRSRLYGYYGSASAVTIPDGVTSIGGYAFSGCSGLTSVELPDSVTSIGSSAFSGCMNLTSVTIPDSVVDMGVGDMGGGYDGAQTVFQGCDKLWTAWYRTLAKCSGMGETGGESSSGTTTIIQQVAAPYDLTESVADRSIASVTVNSNCAIDEFVLKNGKVYDCALRIVNTSDAPVKLSLPRGYEYETFRGAKPLTIPALSRNILTITRTTDNTFLVSCRQLETVE